MRRKVNWRNLLLIFSAIILMVLLAFFLISFISSRFEDTKENNLGEVESVSNFTVDLVDYEVFKTQEEFDFDFVVARLRFRDQEPVSYDLKDMYTDEGLKLSEIDKYVSALEEKHYYLGRLNVVYEISSEENSATYAIFIPYDDKDKDSLTLYDALSKEEITIDLDKNQKELASLEYSTGSDIEVNDIKASISDSFISTTIYQDGQSYSYPESVKIYSFELSINNVLEEGIMIEDAYILLANGEEIHALDDSYTSMKHNNMINRELTDGETGCLFFEMFALDDNSDHNADLYIKFSNSEDWLMLRTELAE